MTLVAAVDDEGVDRRQVLSPDAKFVADAIRQDWIMRGVKLGIGFWLSGVVIVVATVLVLLALGILGRIAASTSEPASAVADVGPAGRQSDEGDWRQRLKSYDDYARQRDAKGVKR
jgi:hypothetical protein